MSRAPARKLVNRPIGKLLPFVANARTHSEAQVAQIAASIREFGWTNPLLVDEQNGLIAGHGRLLAARALGMKFVPCIVVDGLTEVQKRALVIADNKLALNAGWDENLLASELRGLLDVGFSLDLVGFDDASELQRLLADRAEGLTDPDEAPPLEEVVVSKLGDVWLLGRHRLVCGDCTNPEMVALALGDRKPHLMVTDPPYGVSYDPSWREKAGVGSSGSAKGKVLNDDRADWREAWALFPGSVAYVWHGGLHSGVVAESLQASRFGLRAQIVWVKTRPALSRGHYHWQHEPAFYGAREDPEGDRWRFVPEHEVSAYAVKVGAVSGWEGDRKQSTVWFIEHLKSDTGHGTQKPVECMKRPMENNSVPGDAVYEPFSGSGTTIIAGELSGRLVCALELSPAYVDVAVRRWQAFTGKSAVLESSGVSFDDAAASVTSEAA